MTALAYINGRYTPLKNASIGITDLSLQRGYGVFDYARTNNGTLFHFDDHLERLRRSAAELHLTINLSNDELTVIAERVIAESDLQRPAVRIFITGGEVSSPLFERPNIIVLGEEQPNYDLNIYRDGVSLITFQFQRELPQIKSINYLNAIRIEPLRKSRNAFDVLYHSNHGVTECPRNNFFLWKDGVLITPQNHVLHGITRSIVLKLAKAEFSVEQRAVGLRELAEADEAFITSTSKRIVPVTTIDDQPVGEATVGKCTQRLMQLFEDYAAGIPAH